MLCRCRFRGAEGTICRLVSEVAELPLEQAAVSPEACAACCHTDTPQSGHTNSVVVSLVTAAVRQHAPDRYADVFGRLHRYIPVDTRVEGERDPQQAAEQRKQALVRRYLHAVRRWVSAGRPVRTDAEVAAIFAICEQCRHFRRQKDGAGRCAACGCKLKRNEAFAGMLGALANKIRMATEHCWKGLW